MKATSGSTTECTFTPLDAFSSVEHGAKRVQNELREYRADVERRFEDAKAELGAVDEALERIDAFMTLRSPRVVEVKP